MLVLTLKNMHCGIFLFIFWLYTLWTAVQGPWMLDFQTKLKNFGLKVILKLPAVGALGRKRGGGRSARGEPKKREIWPTFGKKHHTEHRMVV